MKPPHFLASEILHACGAETDDSAAIRGAVADIAKKKSIIIPTSSISTLDQTESAEAREILETIRGYTLVFLPIRLDVIRQLNILLTARTAWPRPELLIENAKRNFLNLEEFGETIQFANHASIAEAMSWLDLPERSAEEVIAGVDRISDFKLQASQQQPFFDPSIESGMLYQRVYARFPKVTFSYIDPIHMAIWEAFSRLPNTPLAPPPQKVIPTTPLPFAEFISILRHSLAESWEVIRDLQLHPFAE